MVLQNSTLKIDGIFILRENVIPSYLVKGVEIKMESNHIAIDKNMNTNIKGIYAAGDCAGKPYQYLKSAGQGQIAVMSAIEYLQK